MAQCPESGELRELNFLEELPIGWTLWLKGEVVKIKNCYFKIAGINIPEQQMILKAISEREALTELSKFAKSEIEDFLLKKKKDK